MKRKILLVDDDASLLATLGDFLESEGYEVAKAASGEKALAMLRISQPELIVLDMSMPGIGGMGVLDELKLPDGSMRYPVLVLTARAQMAEYFADKQVDGFIAKPCDPEDLALEISRILFQRGARFPAGTTSRSAPVVYLGEPGPALQEGIRRSFAATACELRVFAAGPALLEAAILDPPALALMRLEMEGQSADTVARLLLSMSRTRALPIIIYGIDEPDAKIEHVAGLNDRDCVLLDTTDPARLREAAVKLLNL